MDPLPGRNFAALFKLAHYRFARALALAVGMVQIGSGGWRRTYRSPTGSGPEGSSPNEPGRVFVQPPTAAPYPQAAGLGPGSQARSRMNDLIADPVAAEPSLGLDLGPSPARAAPYRVLARKYRPASFVDLIGQEAMVRTLANSFKADRIHQAYILTGVRGVGKTTTARILARAFNYSLPGRIDRPSVEMPELGVHCQAIMESRHVDVIEMDAASHTGIDDVREIIENARYRPVSARTKVYIIDEVHMLSKQAFNGLLKTLEEPPEHVKFLFATTEIEKVPITVRSRCIRFDLRRIESGPMAGT